jgi:NADH:ubiquinone oxidoreductase subunit E
MMTTVEPVLPADIVAYIQDCRQKEHNQSYLISVLQKLQQHSGYLTPAQLDAVSQLMQIPAAKVTGVATFYHFFKFQPPGKHKVTVCMGTACYVRGAAKVLERFKESLKIKEGETTPDRLFSIECARCLGACALAPVVVVDEKVYGNVKPGEVRKILSDYQ